MHAPLCSASTGDSSTCDSSGYLKDERVRQDVRFLPSAPTAIVSSDHNLITMTQAIAAHQYISSFIVCFQPK